MQQIFKIILKRRIELALVGVLIGAFWLRVYRINELLWFFYDQGRDALVISEAIHHGKWFLIGPTTGLEGVFIGPFYYYLLTPAYIIGAGSPVVASILVSIISVVGLIFVYLIGVRISKMTGLIGAFLMGVSSYQVKTDRWLANPAPLSLFAPLSFWVMLKSKEQPKKYLPLLGLLAGLNLQLEASGAVFSLISIMIWVVWQKLYKQSKSMVISFGLFAVTILPQLFFDLRHNFIMTKSIIAFVSGSHAQTTVDYSSYFFAGRIPQVLFSFSEKINFYNSYLAWGFVIVSLIGLAWRFKKNSVLGMLFIWTIIPALAMIFYRGNYGYFFDYYLYISAFSFFVLIGAGLSKFAQTNYLRVFLVLILSLYLYWQSLVLGQFLRDGLEGYNTIALKNQLAAIDWVYQQAEGRVFNVDVYVPPTIPVAYDYLFAWYGQFKYHYLPAQDLKSELYTLSEYDTIKDPLKEKTRLQLWNERQDGIGIREKEATFGGIVTQKRTRVKWDKS